MVVVVVANEIVNGIGGKEVAEFAVELSGQRFVVTQHERRSPHIGDHVCHRERLAGTGRTQEHLRGLARVEPFRQRFDRGGLVTGW